MSSIRQLIVPVLAACLFAGGAFAQDETPAVLFLSKSAGFQHSSITEKDGKPSHVGALIAALSEQNGVNVTVTKDASLINAKNLENYGLVIFYTTGDLTTTGTDGHPAMGKNGMRDLTNWIKAGGAFMGFHCAADTFHGGGDVVTPYIEMLGGEFLSHGKQFEGILRVVDPSHPTALSIPRDWKKRDEWYMFKNLNTDNIHVIALMDPGAERQEQEMYNVSSYPVIWCSSLGEGRVYYNAMGHREDVWDDPIFQAMVVDAAGWAMGQGELQAEPNFAKVVPSAINEGSDKKESDKK